MRLLLPSAPHLSARTSPPSGQTPARTPVAGPLPTSASASPGEVRAGVVADGDALFGGASARGGIGDLKIYNDRVSSSFNPSDRAKHRHLGGGVIDIDIVRPPGAVGTWWMALGDGRARSHRLAHLRSRRVGWHQRRTCGHPGDRQGRTAGTDHRRTGGARLRRRRGRRHRHRVHAAARRADARGGAR